MSSLLQRVPAALSTVLLCAFVSAQVDDPFTDGDFINGPAWSGDDALFTVVDDGGDQRLRSNSPGAANYHLSTPSTLVDDTQWELFVDLRFATSGANYADIHLMSDAADLAGGVNGYFVRMGGTADRLELFRSDAGSAVSLGVQSPDAVVNSSSSNPFLVKVTRSATGLFTLFFDDGATGTYTTAGSTTDATYTSATHFGLRIEQSSAGSVVNNHFFDDILVQAIPVDNTPPSILSVIAVSATQVDVTWSEPLDPSFIGTYDILPFIGVSGQVLDGSDATLVHVTPAIALTSGNTYGLVPTGAQDLAGNTYAGPSQVDFSYAVPEVALPGEVVINEILADPTPVVGLPEAEFIEIHNTTTDKTFDLENWTISDGSGIGNLPSVLLPPGSFAILTDDANAADLASFGTVISITSFPSLNNDGDPLSLTNEAATLIDAVTYALSWYNDEAKEDGGWTLERIDPTTPCSSGANWAASNDTQGGTPGEQNSVFAIVPDVTAPLLVNVLVNSATQIELIFNEAMNATSLIGGAYSMAPTIGIGAAVPSGDRNVILDLVEDLVAGQLYVITVTGVTDCVGNTIGTVNTLTFALPEATLPGDVVINEVLYDPLGSGSDFVELYNRSNKVLSLAGWRLANETGGVIGNETVITTAAFLLMPGEYALIAESADNVADQYPMSRTDRFVEADMPSYNNGEGVVVLQDPLGDTLDRFAYDDDLHFRLLNSTDGVSLERVDPDRPTAENTNWHSAAEAVGYATPGYLNSQFTETPDAQGELTIDPAIFSPDNDGYQDLITIAYRLNTPGFTGTMIIFDVAGREVVKLMENEYLGTDGAVSWNGIMEGGELARMGPYIVVFEAFDLEGKVERFRETIVLAHKLN